MHPNPLARPNCDQILTHPILLSISSTIPSPSDWVVTRSPTDSEGFDDFMEGDE